MRDLFILGKGVHGAEMVEIVERVNLVKPTWNLLGFITPEPKQVGTVRNGVPVLGGLEMLDAYPDALFVPDNEWSRTLPIPENRLVSLLDPSVFVSRTARIGAGSVIYPYCFIGLHAVLGRRVFALSGCAINHDCTLENDVVLASGVQLAGSVTVEAGAYLGQACTVRQGLRIGRGSLVGMGATIVKDVPPKNVIVGNPGRVLREG